MMKVLKLVLVDAVVAAGQKLLEIIKDNAKGKRPERREYR